MALGAAGTVRADSVSDDKKFVSDSAQDSLAEINYAQAGVGKEQGQEHSRIRDQDDSRSRDVDHKY